jgi:hypothetical protein
MQLTAYYDSALTTPYTNSNFNFGNFVSSTGASAPANQVIVYGTTNDYVHTIKVNGFDSTKTIAYVPVASGNLVQVGQYLVTDPQQSGQTKDYILCRILSKVLIPSTSPSAWAGNYAITVTAPLANTNAGTITRYQSIQSEATAVKFNYLPGYKMTSYTLPDGSLSQLTKILGLLDVANSNISVGLLDKNSLVYRYIVDTFSGGLNTQSAPKDLLSTLAMNRQQCLAIINPPAMAEFIASTNPRFTDPVTAADPLPLLDTAYIASGGNLSLGPSFTYSLPDEEHGASFCGFFAPYLVLQSGTKNITIPPAADVSNNFVRKFINGQPFSIVAGPRRGVLSNPSLVSLEYNFSDQDRANLEPFGWNPIVYRKNVGFVIYGNQTAYQTVQSALNSLHVRDLLITIEQSVIDILNNYVFEFNDATTRLEVKSTVDKYLDGVLSAGGIYNYKTIMDSTNNTPDIIDQNFAIIDIGIEPVKGMQKIINRITLLKTGAIASGGFSVA